jgi:hypothetical protein
MSEVCRALDEALDLLEAAEPGMAMALLVRCGLLPDAVVPLFEGDLSAEQAVEYAGVLLGLGQEDRAAEILALALRASRPEIQAA